MGRRATAVKRKKVVPKKKSIRDSVVTPAAPPVVVASETSQALTGTMQLAFREYAAKIFGQQHLHMLLAHFGITGMQWATMSKVKRSSLIMLYSVNIPRAFSRKEQKNLARILRQEIASNVKAKKRDLFQVFRDHHGICYLRVDVTEEGTQFAVQLGKLVELVTLDAVALRLRALEPLPQLPPKMMAQRLAYPRSAAVTVTSEAKRYLEHILKTKEFQMNIPSTAPKKKKSTKKSNAATSAKSAAPAKKSAPKEDKPRKSALITLKKTPKEELAPQAQVFIEALKKLGGKNVPTLKLVETVEKSGKLKTKQPTGAIWNHYRRGFIEDGTIGISAAE